MSSKSPWIFRGIRSAFRMPPPRMRLIVFCSRTEMPPLLDIANPESHNGAVAGIPVAVDDQIDSPNELEQPLGVGRYAFSCTRGTLFCASVSRNGRAADAHADLQALDPGSDALTLLKTAPFNVSLTLKRPSCLICDSVLFGAEIADRIAELTGGMIFDVDACRRYGPHQWHVERPAGEVDAREHLTIHVQRHGDGKLWLHTHGLIKFGRPEIELIDVPADIKLEAYTMLLNTSQYILEGTIIKPGDAIGDEHRPLKVRTGRNPDDHYDVPVLELTAGCEQGPHDPHEIVPPVLAWFKRFKGDKPGGSCPH